MRWLWRLSILFLLILLVMNSLIAQPQAFISSQGLTWIQQFKKEVYKIQQQAQDLPMSIEVEIRRLLYRFKPRGEAQSV